jgi:hypothetical protein
MRPQESEPLEEFSQRIYFMALDGFDKGNPEVVDQIATEAFLRGCRDKEAARSVLEKDLWNLLSSLIICMFSFLQSTLCDLQFVRIDT